MLGEKEYRVVVRNYISENLDNNNIYSYLKDTEIELINHYYKAYTVELFKRLRGSLRLQVSDAKAKKLVELKGGGNWDFAGMVDMGKVGKAHCELGHALRYCYYAKNTENGSILKFGVTCVGDFFDLDSNSIKSLNKVKDTMLRELKEIIAIRQLKLTDEHIKYDLGIYGRLLKRIGLEGVTKLNHNKRYSYAVSFIRCGLPLPISLSGFLNDDNTLLHHITPSLLGLDAYIPLTESKITLISKGYKGLCDLEVLKVVDPRQANYSRDIIGKYIDFTDVKKWTFRDKFFTALHGVYSKEGIDNWSKLSIQATHYIKNETLKIDKDVLELCTNLMNSFSIDSNVQRYNLGGVNTIPYKVNGVVVNKKALKNMDYLLEQLNKEEVLDELQKLKEYTNQKIEKILEEVSDDEKIMRYLRLNIVDPKYAVIGKGIEITKDIIFNKGKTLDTMTEGQKKVVLNVHRIMVNMDKDSNATSKASDSNSKEQEVNNVYFLKDREDVRLKINSILNSGVVENLDEKQKGIINNVVKYERVSDKQLNRIEQIYSAISKTKPNNSYFLDEREDVKSKMTRVINSATFKKLDKKTRDIFNTVLRNGRFSDKQLKYICDAYDKLPEGEKILTQNNRYELSARPDLQSVVSALRDRDDLDDKTRDILSSVLKYGRVSDKQLKYLNMAYMDSVLERC